jgi:hypothetical protein
MKIGFSVDEFKALVELVYLGGWMANAIRPPGEQVESLERVEQRILSLAGERGFKDMVEFRSHVDGFVPTSEFEEKMDAYISHYDDETFWDQLVDRLADRDLVAEYGEALKAMPIEQFIATREPVVERYEREAEEHGLQRLRVVEF